MSGERERNIRERAYAIEPMPFGRKKAAQTARALSIGCKQKPKSVTKKSSELRTMGNF